MICQLENWFTYIYIYLVPPAAAASRRVET